ncbi:hypothetical protein N7475_002392 [Penicillium sp. IBT 31633x]|nr:hypothetical protein N7475_002392 [Penicillium sp. IBT 31633x]
MNMMEWLFLFGGLYSHRPLDGAMYTTEEVVDKIKIASQQESIKVDHIVHVENSGQVTPYTSVQV